MERVNLDRFKIPKFDFRTVWISDIHLGTKDCKAESLLLFIKSVNAQKIYLVGDIIDGWALRKRWYWPQSHNDVVQKNIKEGEEEH